MPEEDAKTYYVLVCRDCGDDLPMPFPSPEELGRWAAAHMRATGHERVLVIDQPNSEGSE